MYTNLTNSVPDQWHYLSGVFALLCLLVGGASNGCVLMLFIKYPDLRRPKNYFLISLVLSDLGLLMTNNSMHVIASFDKSWPFGQIGCHIYAVCGGIFGLSSIASMAAIALIRVVVVLTPFTSLKIDSSFTIKCLMCSWLYGSIWILPPLFGWSRFIHEGFGTSCTFDYKSKDPSDRLFMLFLMMGGFIIPLSIIVISYTLIVSTLYGGTSPFPREPLRQNINLRGFGTFQYRLMTLMHQDVRRSEILPIIYRDKRTNSWNAFRRNELRVTRRILITCAVFCCVWCPYAITAILHQVGYGYLIGSYTTSTLALFTKVGACLNPFIYTLSSKNFRAKLDPYLDPWKLLPKRDFDRSHTSYI